MQTAGCTARQAGRQDRQIDGQPGSQAGRAGQIDRTGSRPGQARPGQDRTGQIWSPVDWTSTFFLLSLPSSRDLTGRIDRVIFFSNAARDGRSRVFFTEKE